MGSTLNTTFGESWLICENRKGNFIISDNFSRDNLVSYRPCLLAYNVNLGINPSY